MDLRPTLDPHFRAFGVAATVTPAGGVPVATRIVWDTPQPGGLGIDVDPQLANRPRCALRRDEVAVLAVGSTIAAIRIPARGSETFTVDRVDDTDPEILTAVVH